MKAKSQRSRLPILKRRLKALAVDKELHPKWWGAVRKGFKAILMVAQYGAGRETRVKDFSKGTKLGWLKEDEQTFDFSEASAIYPFTKKGLDECVPALDALLGWVKGIVNAALTRDGANNYILIPLSDGSVVKQLYPKMDKGRVETAHVSSFIRKEKKRKRNVDLISTEEANLEKHLSSTMANLVHGGDSCALVFAGQHFGDIPFTTNHDSVSGRPGKEMDTLVTSLKIGLKEVFVKNPLKKFVELNGLEYREHKPPRYTGKERYNINRLNDATYPYS